MLIVCQVLKWVLRYSSEQYKACPVPAWSLYHLMKGWANDGQNDCAVQPLSFVYLSFMDAFSLQGQS